MDIKNQELIRENLRYKTYSGYIDNQRVFIKKIVDPKLKNTVFREIGGLISMYELDPSEKYYQVPQFISFTDDTLMTTWIDGYNMSERFKEETEKYVQVLFKLYKYLDSRTSSGRGFTRFNHPRKPSNIDRTLERLEGIGIEKHIDKNIILELGDYLNKSVSEVETRFTHGDLQPGNIIITQKEVPAIIDCEACSWLYPRHYNIVNFVFNYCMSYEDKKYLKYLDEYFKYTEMEIDETVKSLVNFTAGLRSLHILDEILIGNTNEGQDNISEKKIELLIKMADNILNNRVFNSI